MGTHGHPTSMKSWTPQSVCGHIFAERVSDEQKCLSGGIKILGQYRPALNNVYTALSKAENEHCVKLANEWNVSHLPDDVQRK